MIRGNGALSRPLPNNRFLKIRIKTPPRPHPEPLPPPKIEPVTLTLCGAEPSPGHGPDCRFSEDGFSLHVDNVFWNPEKLENAIGIDAVNAAANARKHGRKVAPSRPPKALAHDPVVLQYLQEQRDMAVGMHRESFYKFCPCKLPGQKPFFPKKEDILPILSSSEDDSSVTPKKVEKVVKAMDVTNMDVCMALLPFKCLDVFPITLPVSGAVPKEEARTEAMQVEAEDNQEDNQEANKSWMFSNPSSTSDDEEIEVVI